MVSDGSAPFKINPVVERTPGSDRLPCRTTVADNKDPRPCLTIAGHDPFHLAGATADLRTFASVGVDGVSVLTALIAQTPDEFRRCIPADADLVRYQIRTVGERLGAIPVKIGLVPDRYVAKAILDTLPRRGTARAILDPVLSPSADPRWIFRDAESLFPRVDAITPNIPETETLLEASVRDLNDMKDAAETLGTKYGCSVLVKGGHLKGADADVFYHRKRVSVLPFRRADAPEVHGSGCFLSASIAAHTARGCGLTEAVRKGQAHTVRAFGRLRSIGGFPVLDCPAGTGRRNPG